MKAWGLLTAALIVGASALVTVRAQGSPPYSGNGDYQVYCASCHGAEARGDGMIAKSLKKRPPISLSCRNATTACIPKRECSRRSTAARARARRSGHAGVGRRVRQGD